MHASYDETRPMTISPEEAAQALASVDSADRRMDTLRAYRGIAPFMQLWGVVWIVANIATEIRPSAASTIWQLASGGGLVGTVAVIVWQSRERSRLALRTASERRRIRGAFAMLGVTLIAYFVSMSLVLGHLDARQSNAFVSLFWAITYMAAGSWLGLRLFMTGLIAVIGIVAGYQFIHEHFELWMALFGGGSLVLAGFWLRRP